MIHHCTRFADGGGRSVQGVIGWRELYLEGSVGCRDIPHVDLALAKGSTNQDRLVLVELEVDNPGRPFGSLGQLEVVGGRVKLNRS